MKNSMLLTLMLFTIIGCENGFKNSLPYDNHSNASDYKYDSMDIALKRAPIQFLGKYPKIIDSLLLRNIYDESVWMLSSIYWGDTCEGMSDSIDKSALFRNSELKYEGYDINKDTINLFFSFYYKGKIRLADNTCTNIFPIHGISISYKSKSILAYIDSKGGTWFEGYIHDHKLRGYNYIKNHKNEIPLWLLNEAKKHKIVD